MRVLLDECLPEGLRAELPGHQVLTAREAGLAGKKDGDLLAAASGRFDAFLTMDRSLQWQQRVSAFDLRVVIIRARSNSLLSIRRSFQIFFVFFSLPVPAKSFAWGLEEHP